MFIFTPVIYGGTPSEVWFAVWVFILFLIIIAIIGYIIFYLYLVYQKKVYCENCNKRIHSIIRDHRCKIRDTSSTAFEKVIDKELKDIENTNLKKYFMNEREKRIYKSNMKNFLKFNKGKNYKFCMIQMGSILEFLLERYCDKKGYVPLDNSLNPLSSKTNPRFYHYLQSAIHNNIFDMKKRWEEIQTKLRPFRNYIHIKKELQEDEIDGGWYKSIKPHFDELLKTFKETQV